jgi:hypothetical protein
MARPIAMSPEFGCRLLFFIAIALPWVMIHAVHF